MVRRLPNPKLLRLFRQLLLQHSNLLLVPAVLFRQLYNLPGNLLKLLLISQQLLALNLFFFPGLNNLAVHSCPAYLNLLQHRIILLNLRLRGRPVIQNLHDFILMLLHGSRDGRNPGLHLHQLRLRLILKPSLLINLPL